MVQIKLFCNIDGAELQKDVNIWLVEHTSTADHTSVTIRDIKIAMGADTQEQEVYITATIIYEQRQ